MEYIFFRIYMIFRTVNIFIKQIDFSYTILFYIAHMIYGSVLNERSVIHQLLTNCNFNMPSSQLKNSSSTASIIRVYIVYIVYGNHCIVRYFLANKVHARTFHEFNVGLVHFIMVSIL